MSAKSVRSTANGDQAQSVSQMPEVDNSDFADQQTTINDPPPSESSDAGNTSFEHIDHHSLRSAGSSMEEIEPATQVNDAPPTSTSAERDFVVEIDATQQTEQVVPNDGEPVNEEVGASSTAAAVNSTNMVESNSGKVDSTNSLYDSNEKLVFSRSTSEFGEGDGEQSLFWKSLLLATMLPYAAVGVPVAGMYQLAQQSERVTSAKQWLRFLFESGSSMLIHLAELGLFGLFNLYVLYLFVGPVYSLARYGQMSERLISLSLHLYELIPLLAGLCLVWPKGFWVGNIAHGLDAKIIQRENAQDQIKIYQGLTKMAASYVCLMIVTVASIVSFEWKNAYSYITELRADFYYHLVVRFFLMLLLPVYLAVISGLHRRVLSLNHYIRSMASADPEDMSAVSLADFQRVKNIFKQNADIVCATNRVFNALVSSVLLIVVVSFLKDLFQVFMLVAALDSFTISLEKGSRHVDPELLSIATSWMGIDITVAVCKCALIGLTVSKVAATNREISHTQPYLHDLASNYIEKPTEIYQSFSLVKSYIKARNEKSDKPALLRLSAVRWIPCVSLRSKSK